MSDPVRGNKIIKRGILFAQVYDLVDLCFGSVRQKDRTGMGIGRIYMTDPVNLLFFPGVFMLPDRSGQIIVNGRAANDTGLAASIHGQLINIEAGRFVLYKMTILNLGIQKLSGFLVYPVIVGINISSEHGLCPVDGKERKRFPSDLLKGFVSVIYIIGKGGNPVCKSRIRSDSLKGGD